MKRFYFIFMAGVLASPCLFAQTSRPDQTDAPGDSEVPVQDSADMVQPFFGAVGEVMGVASGGLERETAWASLMDFGFDVDVEAWAGLQGGLLHVHFQTVYGENFSDKVGDFHPASNIEGFNTTRLFQLCYQGEFADDYTFRFGLLSLDDHYMLSEHSALMINSSFGPLPVQSGNSPAPIWPLGAPAVNVIRSWDGSGYLQAGVFDGNAGEEETNDDGLHIRLNSDDGAMFMVEGGVPVSLRERSGMLQLGGFYDSGEFEDFSTGGTRRGMPALYAGWDQDWTDRLSSWIRAGFAFGGGATVVRNYADAGLVFRRPFLGRKNDAAGIGVSYTDFGSDYMNANPATQDGETVFELTYQLVVSEYLSIQPDVQWIVNPHAGDSDALIVGVRASLEF